MSETATVEPKPAPKPEHRCEHHYEDGSQCRGTKTRTGKCAGHSRLGIAANPSANADKANETRREKAREVAARPKTLKEALQARLEARAADVTAKYEGIALDGTSSPDTALRALEQWISRVYGKPTDHVATTVQVPEALADLHGKSAEERAELLRSLAAGKRLRLVLEDEPEIPANSDISSAQAAGE